MNKSLIETFGNIDIYLFDQLLKGRFKNDQVILDVGCGTGRNLVYFLQNGFTVFGLDRDPEAITEVLKLTWRLAPALTLSNFKVGMAEDMPFLPNQFDLVICSAVLHFAQDRNHFEDMLSEIWRVLRPGGFLFARLASTIGIEHLVQDLGNGQYLLPDGSRRYLVSEFDLLNYTQQLNANLFEAIKTTLVQNLRSMTTWCLQKKS